MVRTRIAVLLLACALPALAGPLPASLPPTTTRLTPSTDWTECAPSGGWQAPTGPQPPAATDVEESWAYPLEGSWPLRSGYGWRTRHGQREFHPGLDLAADAWTPVVASRTGVVEFAGDGGDFGNLVILLHPDGDRSYYGHLNRLLVRKGQRIKRLARLGLSGSTGKSDGAHLHFEVRRRGRTVDPAPLLGLAVAAR